MDQQPIPEKRPARNTPDGKRKVRPSKSKKKLRDPSLRQKRAAAALVGPAKGNQTQALLAAEYSPATAQHHQKRVFENPVVKQEIARLLESKGLTDEHAALRLYEASNAESTKSAEIGKQVDHPVRLEAVRMFFQLTGRLTNKVEIENHARNFTEQIVLVLEKYVPTDKRDEALDEIIALLGSAASG